MTSELRKVTRELEILNPDPLGYWKLKDGEEHPEHWSNNKPNEYNWDGKPLTQKDLSDFFNKMHEASTERLRNPPPYVFPAAILLAIQDAEFIAEWNTPQVSHNAFGIRNIVYQGGRDTINQINARAYRLGLMPIKPYEKNR